MLTTFDWFLFALLFFVCVFLAPLLAWLKDRGIL